MRHLVDVDHPPLAFLISWIIVLVILIEAWASLLLLLILQIRLSLRWFILSKSLGGDLLANLTARLPRLLQVVLLSSGLLRLE